MPDKKKLLELRSKIKKKRPEFIRQEYGLPKRGRIKRGWKRPRGLHSKIRENIKGRRRKPSPGFRAPLLVRGLHVSGVIPVLVSSVSQIPQGKEYGIIISGKVGQKKRIEIIKKAQEFGIPVLNIDAVAYLKKTEEAIASKKKQKEQKKDKKKEESKIPEGAAEKKPDKKDEVPKDSAAQLPDETAAKKEMDKALITRA